MNANEQLIASFLVFLTGSLAILLIVTWAMRVVSIVKRRRR